MASVVLHQIPSLGLQLDGLAEAVRWATAPASVKRLLHELFETQPEDCLTWLHAAVWRLREEELLVKGSLLMNAAPHHNKLATYTPTLPGSGSSSSGRHSDRSSTAPPVPVAPPPPPPLPPVRELDVAAFDGGFPEFPSPIQSVSLELETIPSVSTSGDPRQIQILTRSGAMSGWSQQSATDRHQEEGGANFFLPPSPAVFRPKSIVPGNGMKHMASLMSQQSQPGEKTPTTPEKRRLRRLNFAKGTVMLQRAQHQLRRVWDMLLFMALAAELCFTPFSLIYWQEDDVTQIPDRAGHVLLVDAVLIAFCIDVFLRAFDFVILTNDTNGCVLLKTTVNRWYLQSWFWLDAATLLTDLLLLAAQAGGTVVILVKAGTRTCRVWRQLKLLSDMWQYKALGWRATLFLDALNFAMLLVIIAVPQAAVWCVLQPDPRSLADSPLDLLLRGFWWVYIPLLSGTNPEAVSSAERALEICVSTEHLMLYVFVWTRCAQRVLRMDMLQSEEAAAEDGVLSCLRDHRVSIDLQLRASTQLQEISDGYRRQQGFNRLAERLGDDKRTFTKDLQRRICQELWYSRLLSLGLLQKIDTMDDAFVEELGLLVRQVSVAAQATLFHASESSTSAYLLLRGVMKVSYSDGHSSTADYMPGMWLGDKALVNPDIRRHETLVSKVWCDLMEVPSAAFWDLLEERGLTEQYRGMLQDTLWRGLCGRCGALGSHFSFECQQTVLEAERRRSWASRFAKVTLGRELPFGKRRSEVGAAELNSLQRYLSQFVPDAQRVSELSCLLERYGISNLDDLVEDDVRPQLADEIRLNDKEYRWLSPSYVKKFQEKLKQSAMRLLNMDTAVHWIFVSHYKVEAGTEAALIEEDMGRLMASDPGSYYHNLERPVFVDTEDLQDLDELQGHVRNSRNILLLLTTNVLARPWVLLEIVTAQEAGVRVIPVEVQRPGVRFEYPTEAYFQRVGQGQALNKEAEDMLKGKGVELKKLEEVLRTLFKRISVQYSPHKPWSIRQAELTQILNQCQLSMPEPGDGGMVVNKDSLTARGGRRNGRKSTRVAV